MRMFLLTAWIVMVAAVGTSTAQYYGSGGYGYGDNRATTVGESRAKGMAYVINARGERNLRNSEAMINVERARADYIDNRFKATQTYFEMRKMNRAYRQAEAGPPMTQQLAEKIARDRAPKRARSNELDPITGGLAWPMPLTSSNYAKNRKKLDELFAKRAQHGGNIGYDTYTEIKRISDSMLKDLKKNIRNYSGSDYMACKRFIERIAYEAKFPSA